MAYHLDDLRFAAFPDDAIVSTALAGVGLPRPAIEAAIRAFVCNAPQTPGFGYQQHIADHLEAHLRTSLAVPPVQQLPTKVSPALNEKADLALGITSAGPAAYFEIEFRPNIEKDLVKFQIARNRDRLAVAVLIVATYRLRINPGYTTMPEFDKVARIIAELRPPYPLLLAGIGGEHRE
jgi:hypothetical protein